MNKICFWVIIILGIIIAAGNITMLFLFFLTTVGLTPQEQIMLTMTSNQINQLHMTACDAFDQLKILPNVTVELLIQTQNLRLFNEQHNSQVESTKFLNESATTRKAELLAYNSTIEQQMSVIQSKIDGVIFPPTFNLTADDQTTMLANGTVLLQNPNNPNENTTLTYKVKSQFNQTVFIEIGPASSFINYNTLGASNWVSLIGWDPPLFVNGTLGTGSFSIDQVLDDQRNKISVTPPIGTREYNINDDEIKLKFSALLVGMQPITLNELLEINVGFI